MKYNFLKFKDVFVKKVVRFLVLESILIFLYMKLSSSENLALLVFGSSSIIYSDQLLFIIKVITIMTLMYSTYHLFFYDLYNNPEFIMLRMSNKDYILKKMSLIIVFNVLYKIVTFIIMYFFFKGGIDMFDLMNGIINIIFLTLIGIMFIIVVSSKRYVLLSMIFVLFLINFVLGVNCFLIYLVISIILFIINIKVFRIQTIYDKFIR